MTDAEKSVGGLDEGMGGMDVEDNDLPEKEVHPVRKQFRLGMIVRGDHTGLGSLSRTFYKYLQPDRVLCIEPNRPYKQDYSYVNTPLPPITVSPPIDHSELYSFLDGLDVVFGLETFYEPQFPTIARSRKVRTVLMPMPEYMPWIKTPKLAAPDTFILPTPWLQKKVGALGFDHVVLPPPIDSDEFPIPHIDQSGSAPRNQAKRFLHIVGRLAKYDRAGTQILFDALPYIKSEIEIMFRSQGPINLPAGRYGVKKNVRVYVAASADLHNSRDLYKPQFDVLIAPRRYGGLSLPLWEAMAQGMPVIALNREPESDILPSTSLVHAYPQQQADLSSGSINIYTCDPKLLAAKIDELAESPQFTAELSLHSTVHAQSLQWPALEDRYLNVLYPSAKKPGSLPGLPVKANA